MALAEPNHTWRSRKHAFFLHTELNFSFHQIAQQTFWVYLGLQVPTWTIRVIQSLSPAWPPSTDPEVCLHL